ncbi:DNA-binding protein [Cryobacterium sp. MDB1-18-2]|uniref:helix-turn-helix domain-containing protein n=1 Tax=unclassified Cryobacterium TaxID=2649013 RepID=UPI00106D2BA7|nr:MULTISPECIES: helix-turn-helix domain-containing protein [unclassified Cryobacterium]TFC26997.1 DNA-binding protein [Cryobacterium sp. MDB1-18-2]TFC44189.1 DNA-binding protein [Cryobacterium sp. MDB1-18-1]
MPAETTTGWITIQDAAEQFQCSTKTVRRWITQGRIVAKRFGPKLIRVSTTSLDTFGRSLNFGGASE